MELGRNFIGEDTLDRHVADQAAEFDLMLDAKIKGLPAAGIGKRLSDIGSQRWALTRGDIPLPAAVIRNSALSNNRRWMQEFLKCAGVSLAPHGKTTMSPQLFALQMEDGAWGLTVATIQQLRVARRAGIRRVILANQLVGRLEIVEVIDEINQDPTCEIYCFVDSIDGVKRFSSAAFSCKSTVPVRLLIEVGYFGGRAGCRDIDSALAVAQAVASAAPYTELHGVAGYEGLISASPEAEEISQIEGFLAFLVEVAQKIEGEKLFSASSIILSAGGSAYIDLVSKTLAEAKLHLPTEIILRSGCYITHDGGLYRALFNSMQTRSPQARAVSGGLENALEVWTYVQSLPEPGRAILSAGRRDFGHDAGPPLPVKLFKTQKGNMIDLAHEQASIVSVNDQHAHLSFVSDLPLQIGDMIGLAISHPCTTFDKWQLVYLVDDAYTIIDAILTYF